MDFLEYSLAIWGEGSQLPEIEAALHFLRSDVCNCCKEKFVRLQLKEKSKRQWFSRISKLDLDISKTEADIMDGVPCIRVTFFDVTAPKELKAAITAMTEVWPEVELILEKVTHSITTEDPELISRGVSKLSS